MTMRFARIRLENWRNFGQVDVSLQNRAFLVGANASGKSNFLDVFRFLRDLVIPGGGFQEAVNSRGGVSRLRNLAARYPNTNIVVDAELITDSDRWRYRVEFNQDERSRPFLKQELVQHNKKVIIERPDDDDLADKARLRQTYLEQTFANKDFREIADFFISVSYSHIVPQLVRDSERYIGRQSDPFGGDFLEQIENVRVNTRNARLRRIEIALKKAIPQLSDLRWSREKGVPHLHGKYEHWRPQGAWQTEIEFSDGTLRLIGLLWTLQDGEGPLLLEEPELSLHPGVVRQLPQMIQSVQRERKKAYRQIFISTHSSELLSDESIAPDEVLLFKINEEGTMIVPGVELPEIQDELDAGLTMAEAVMSRTEPPGLYQLPLFDQ